MVPKRAAFAGYAAGRGRCRCRRAASSRAFRRESSATTLAGRATACVGRVATRTRCRCISPPLVVWSGSPRGRGARRRGLLTRRYREGSVSSAGGIRTRDLELMRLARTAAPLPRGVSVLDAQTQDVHATRLRFDPGSARPSYVGALWSPESSRRSTKRQAKSAAYCAAGINPRRIGWELFSLRRGLECSYVLFKLGITSLSSKSASETTKATSWVALDPMVMRLFS
jgi:hypothetical protein